MNPDLDGRRCPAGYVATDLVAYVDKCQRPTPARRRSRLRRRCCARALSSGGTTTPWAAIWRRTFRRVMMIAPAPIAEQQELDAQGNPERIEAVQLALGEAAGVEDVKHHADQVDGHQCRNEPADVDDPGGGSDPVGRVEGAGEVEADHGTRPADGQHHHQPGEQPQRRAARHQQHRRPGRRGGGGRSGAPWWNGAAGAGTRSCQSAVRRRWPAAT